MSEFQETRIESATPRWVGLAIGALGLISVVGLGLGWSALSKSGSIEQSTQASLKQQNDALTAADQGRRPEPAIAERPQGRHRQAKCHPGRLGKGPQAVSAAVATYGKKISGIESNVNAVNTQLATKASTEDVNKLNGDVTGVKNDLDQTKAKLERATGDMGVMSGLIARNHDDVEELKRRGDRNYYEFTIQKSKTPAARGPGLDCFE